METRSSGKKRQRVITDPGDYMQKHNVKKQKILKIQDEKITKESEWYKATSPDRHDNHTEKYLMRFMYVQRYKENNYLMVSDNGTVCVNGTANDERTLFEVVHDFSNCTFKFVCMGGPCKNDIFYMDGDNLKTRPCTIQDLKKNNAETLFDVRGIGSASAYEIYSRNGNYQLRFDSNGQFITPKKAKKNNQLQGQHYFAPFRTVQIKYTTV